MSNYAVQLNFRHRKIKNKMTISLVSYFSSFATKTLLIQRVPEVLLWYFAPSDQANVIQNLVV